jgi:hypothetical protein
MPYETWGCSICGKQAPKRLRADGMFEERMKWLRDHRQKYHPTAFKASIKKGIATRTDGDGHLTTEGLQCTVISVGKAK